ncbi:MAG: Gfo/Idh/MocA family oxidoreductase [Bacteroidales bacterium]|nr:Gfo/Idh/MocA family oxidoreductase [Bacteroidales bacterium]
MVRRDFLKASAIGAAGIMMPAGIVSASAASKKAPAKKSANGTINMGFIGLGQQAMYLLQGFMKMDDVRVVAGCDVYDIKRDRFAKRVTNYYQEKGEKKVKVDMYEDYQELLARPDIDAVVIAVPDHQHAIIAIAACKAGKDVYLEKPMTLTIFEGQQLVKAVRKYNRILQVGSQQRSSDEFITAATHAREGDLGQIHKIKVYVGRNNANPNSAAPVPCPLPKMEVPAGLNWDKWLGPLPTSVYYHSDLDPIINDEHDEQLWGAWRWYKPMGGGLMTDWGAHMFDIAQWAIGKDGSGPVEIIPAGYSFYEHLTYKYDNGIIVSEEPFDGSTPGVQIYGEDGWIKVSRGKYEASDKKLEMKAAAGDDSVPYETKVGHHRAFIEAVKSRIDPNVPVEVGHSSCTVCNLGNIAMDLGRPVVWNPIVQKFMHDPEATKLMHYDYRPGYKLDI